MLTGVPSLRRTAAASLFKVFQGSFKTRRSQWCWSFRDIEDGTTRRRHALAAAALGTALALGTAPPMEGEVLFQTVFCSEDAPAQDRIDRWQELTTKTCTPTDVTSDRTDDFEATPRTLGLGAPFLAPTTFGPLWVLRTPKMIYRSNPDVYHLALPLCGPQRLTRVGRDTALAAGEMVLYDSSRPFRATVSPWRGSPQLVQVQFPKALLPLAPGNVGRLIGVRLSGQEGIGALLADFLTRLVSDADGYRPADATRLGGILLGLLTALFAHELEAEASVPAESRRRSLLLRIQRFIERYLGDDRLSPHAVAAAHDISVSYLYKLFQEQGLTVAGWIRERRLENCRRDLAEPGLNSRPVHAIGARWGFTSNAHFSRAFRTAYGMPPTEYRNTAMHSRRVREPSTTVEGRSTTY